MRASITALSVLALFMFILGTTQSASAAGCKTEIGFTEQLLSYFRHTEPQGKPQFCFEVDVDPAVPQGDSNLNTTVKALSKLSRELKRKNKDEISAVYFRVVQGETYQYYPSSSKSDPDPDKKHANFDRPVVAIPCVGLSQAANRCFEVIASGVNETQIRNQLLSDGFKEGRGDIPVMATDQLVAAIKGSDIQVGPDLSIKAGSANP